MFKIGQQVKYVGSFEYLRLRIGVVNKILNTDGSVYDVIFDGWKKGHDGNNNDHSTNHWNCKRDELIAVDEPELELTPVYTPEPKDEILSAHYNTDHQPIEVMQANMTSEAFQGFLRGNIIKYTCRYGKKDEKIKEAKKIVDYAMWLLCEAMGKKVEPTKVNHKLVLAVLGK